MALVVGGGAMLSAAIVPHGQRAFLPLDPAAE